MDVPKNWVVFLCMISLMDPTSANIDNKEYFCGKKLVKVLAELCAIYNSPFDNYRSKRHIIEECCRTQCSRRHLVQYYCSKAKSSIVDDLLRPPPNETEFSKHAESYQSDAANEIKSSESLTRVKKSRQMLQRARTNRLPAPPPNIGQIEDSQKPFYVWRMSHIV